MSLPLIPATAKQEEKIWYLLSIEKDRHYQLVEMFKEWIKSESHLPYDVDESYLSWFLALCKDDLVKTKKKFEASIISRRNQYWLSHETFLTADDFKTLNIARSCLTLPKLTEDGYRVNYMSFPNDVLTKNIDMNKYCKYWIVLSDTVLFEDKPAGLIVIGDYANYTLEMSPKLDLVVITQFAKFFLYTLPARLKHYHAINVPAFAKPLINLIRTTLPTKLKNRLIIHNNAEDLKNYLGDEYIPAEYGGTLTCLDDLTDAWTKYYLENEEWKRKLMKLRLRGEIPREKLHLDPSYGFGAEGSFRNLQVD